MLSKATLYEDGVGKGPCDCELGVKMGLLHHALTLLGYTSSFLFYMCLFMEWIPYKKKSNFDHKITNLTYKRCCGHFLVDE